MKNKISKKIEGDNLLTTCPKCLSKNIKIVKHVEGDTLMDEIICVDCANAWIYRRANPEIVKLEKIKQLFLDANHRSIQEELYVWEKVKKIRIDFYQKWERLRYENNLTKDKLSEINLEYWKKIKRIDSRFEPIYIYLSKYKPPIFCCPYFCSQKYVLNSSKSFDNFCKLNNDWYGFSIEDLRKINWYIDRSGEKFKQPDEVRELLRGYEEYDKQQRTTTGRRATKEEYILTLSKNDQQKINEYMKLWEDNYVITWTWCICDSAIPLNTENEKEYLVSIGNNLHLKEFVEKLLVNFHNKKYYG